jgi:protoporphyrinogen oxidase
MRTEQVDTLVLGAGPAGLAASYTLAKAGRKPLLLERDKVCGGLMRSIQRGEFIMDIGRKELYNRLSKVDTFWQEILGSDYRLYPHRGGLLYDGHIIDLSPAYQGFRRGMPWSMFFKCGANFLWSRAKPKGPSPRTVEEFFYEKRGRELTRIVSQGFQEKLTGRKWAEIPLAQDATNNHDPGFIRTVKDAMVRTFSKKEPNTYMGIWRHPAKGTGQICQFLERGIVQYGGQIQNNVKLLEMQHAGGTIHTVTAEVASETIAFKPAHVISSIPLEFLVQLLPKEQLAAGNGPENKEKSSPFRRKTVVLVYLFLDEEPRFPHAWLNVTCPKTKIGRITNYAGLNGDMVPKGKTCLCCEFYCFDEDPMLQMDNKQFVDLTLQECAKFKLLDPAKCFDNLVLRLPGADASQNRHNWLSKIRLGLLEQLKPYRNLYYTNRTDLDIATLAGIESAEAVMSGDRTTFDRHIDPTQIGIRSEPKAFEFKIPAGQEA